MNSEKATDQIESSKIKLESLNDSDGEFYDAPQDLIQNQADEIENIDLEDDEEEEKRIQENLLRKLDQENNDFDSTTPAFKNIDSKFQNLNLNKEENKVRITIYRLFSFFLIRNLIIFFA
jgi:hypothetical protein